MDEKIHYSDLISADDSIKNLISQLEQLNRTFSKTLDLVRGSANSMAAGLGAATGATQQGREAIEQTAVAASRLAKGIEALNYARSEEGRQLAYVRYQTSEVNKLSVEQARQIKAAAGSYEDLRLRLESEIRAYKELGAAQRSQGKIAEMMLGNIQKTRAELKALDDRLKPTIERVTELQKVQEKLRITQERLAVTSTKEYESLLKVQNGLKQKTAYQKAAIEYEAQLAKAQISRIDMSRLEVYSYDLLSAAYKKMKLEVNAMNATDERSLQIKRETEEQLKKIYGQMIKLQEATGRHQLSVGNYGKVWNGLGYSVQQVVRELPSAAISLNTLFLAVSNNIPIVIDEIKKMRVENERLVASGQKANSIFRVVMGSLFSLQTALMLVITAFSMYGDEILDAMGKMLGFGKSMDDATERMDALRESLKKNDESFGKNTAALSKLRDQWDHLQESDRAKWVKHNATVFEQLGVSITGVNEAESLFSSPERVRALSRSLYERARAAAAASVAADKFKESLQDYVESKQIAESEPGWRDYVTASVNTAVGWFRSDKIEYGGTFDAKLRRARGGRAAAYKDMAELAAQNASEYTKIEVEAENAARKVLADAGLRPYEGEGHAGESSRTRVLKDLTDRINKQSVELYKKMETSKTNLYQDELAKREKSAEDGFNVDVKRLELIKKRNEDYLAGMGPKYKALTDAQKEQLREQNAWIEAILANERLRMGYIREQIGYERQLRAETMKRASLGGASGMMEASITRERDIKIDMLKSTTTLKRKANESVENASDPGAKEARELEITREYSRELAKLYAQADKEIYSIRLRDYESQLALVEKFSDDELALGKKRIEAQKKIALASNILSDPTQQKDPAKIAAEYNKALSLYEGNFLLKKFELEVKAEQKEASLRKKSRRQREVEELDFERKLMLKKLELYNAGQLQLSQPEVDALNAGVAGNVKKRNELTGLKGFIKGVGDNGIGGGILEQMGFDEDYISAMDDVVGKTIDNINSIMQAEIELAEEQKRLADERVERAQKVLDAEIEARNNGYASNVASAQKNLELEKRNQEKKAKILEQAQRRQEAINSLTQASSLVTASAQLWSTFSGMGPVGPALALAAIAGMWASFAVSKVKAKQVSKAQQEKYGEGGLEFLEGGSHASGNDIDLHTKNRKGRNMRAEGGEALAIINKGSTKRYRKVLPDIIESLNKGVFEETYTRAFSKGERLQAVFNSSGPDISRLENSVDAIKKQNETKIFALGNGTTLMIKGNVKRFIKN